MEVIRNIMDNNVYVILTFIASIFGAIGVTYKFIKFIINEQESNIQNSMRLYLIIILCLCCLFIAPIFIIIRSFSWHGFAFWASQVLGWYALFNFILLIIFFTKIFKLFKE